MAKIDIGSDFNIEELLEIWEGHILAGQTFMIVGNTGIGKTEWIKELGKRVEKTTKTKTIVKMFHPARTSNTDYVIPIVQNGEVVRKLTTELLEIMKDKDKSGNPIRIIAGFDEYDRAEGMTRNALLSLLNEREIEGYKLPDTTSIILAGNQEFSGDTYSLNEAEKTRIPIYKIDIRNLTKDSSYLKHWLFTVAAQYNIDKRITSFIAANPSYLFYPEEGTSTFATPRSWTQLSAVLPSTKKVSKDTRNFVIKSYIGNEPASRFIMYIDYILSLPSASEIIKKKLKFDTIDKQYASLYILSNAEPKLFEDAIDYVFNNYNADLLFIYLEMLLGADETKKMLKKFLGGKSKISSQVVELLSNIQTSTWTYTNQ